MGQALYHSTLQSRTEEVKRGGHGSPHGCTEQLRGAAVLLPAASGTVLEHGRRQTAVDRRL